MKTLAPVTVEEERSSSTVLGLALSYAARGMAVFPLVPGGKLPLTNHGFHDATTETEPIVAWWTLHPRANVGIATGTTSNLVALDVDGPEGEASLAGFGDGVHDALNKTVVVVTPHGAHFWFRAGGAAPTQNSTKKIAPGLDVRSTGGYVVAPSSKLSETEVYWFAGQGRRIQPWPAELQPPENEPLSATQSPSRYDAHLTAPGDRYVAAALEGELAAILTAPPGTRNERLNIAAYKLFRFPGLDADAVATVLLDAALSAGLTEYESRATVKSAREARGR